MRVYRVENEYGEGPYSGTNWSWQREPHCSDSGHPGPYTDKGIAEYWPELCAAGMIFGFASEEQFQDWFRNSEELMDLHEEGFSLVTYYVPMGTAVVGEKQCVFDKGCAHYVSTTNLLEYA